MTALTHAHTSLALAGALLLGALGGCEDLDDSEGATAQQQAFAPIDAAVAPVDAAAAPVPADCAGGAQVDQSLIGWATEAGGTTGGKGGATVTVRSGAELVKALGTKRKNPAPLTILIEGTITPANSGVEKIDLKEVENVSLIGAGAGATLDGIGIKLVRARNVVIRNLRIRDVRTGDKDAISIEGPVDHVWVDHCELSAKLEGVGKDDFDGLLDAKAESQYLTYSWNYLHDSWKTALVGSSESDTFDRKLTIHHNRFERCNSRLPLFRGGNGHIFNNYYRDIVDTGVNARLGACLRVEANLFSNAKNPWVSAYSDKLGAMELRCNAVRDGSTFAYDDERRAPLTCKSSVPYPYAQALNHAEALADIIVAHAGVGKLADPTKF